MRPEEVRAFLSETLAGRYRLHEHLESGNFSGAFVARDEQLDRDVAAKILKLSQCGQPEARQEFQDEVKLLRKLAGCDHVIELRDSGQHTVHLRHSASGESIPVTTEFAVLELAAGSLANLLLYGPVFAWSDRLALYRDVVKGVHQMHLKAVVHRDIKAENGLVTERPTVAKIADLGRGHDTSEPSRFPVEAYLRGRGDAHFAPYELLWLQGTQNPDEQALGDVFLLGALLFEIGTGVALTAVVTGDPMGVIMAQASRTEADRERNWRASIPKLREAARPAMESFAQSAPAAIAASARSLLESLAEPDPTRRLDAARGSWRRSATPWDLQWLIERIDALRRVVDPAERKRYLESRPKGQHGRPRSRR